MTPTYTYPDAYYRYRYFDTTAQILYVGSTCHLARRRGEHSRHSHWWPQVDHSRTLVDVYPTARECAEAESECYWNDHPLYNLRPPTYYGTPGPRMGLDGTKLADELAWCALNEARRLSREGVPFPEWDTIDLDDYDDAYYAEVAASQAALDAHRARCRAETAADKALRARSGPFIPAAAWQLPNSSPR